MNTREETAKLATSLAKQATHFKQHESHYAHKFMFWECDKLSQ